MDHFTLHTKQLAVDEDGTIEGIAWPYATPDRAGDIIRKGALRLPVAELPMLWPRGRWFCRHVETRIKSADG